MSDFPIELQLDSDIETASIKVPPHSIEAEQSVLGGLMLDNNAFDDVAELVSDVDFYRRDHRLIFRAIAQLAEWAEQGEEVRLVPLARWCRQGGVRVGAAVPPWRGGLPARLHWWPS